MSEFKFTPGTWKASIHPTLNTRELAVIANENYDGEPEGLHIMISYIDNKEINRANAVLIAHAPDMINLLQRFIDHNMLSHAGDELAKELIQKATKWD